LAPASSLGALRGARCRPTLFSFSTSRASNAQGTAAADSFVGMNGQMLTSVTQIAWWCGGMGPYFRSHLRARAGLFPRSALAPLKRSHQQQWCGEKGLLRKAWRVPSQPLARESSAAPTNSLGASTAPSSTTVVRGKGSASQRLAREIAAPCARKQFCSHALL
jgi:hypothetical protein